MRPRYRLEFRDDVVRVMPARDAQAAVAEIDSDFGIHVGTLDKWLRQARIESGEQPGVTESEGQELRQLRRRSRLLRQGNEAPRRAAAYLSRANFRLGESPS